jgi:triacylglycerol lipase
MTESANAPIVLVHGILGFNQLTLGGARIAEYFRLIPETLRAAGQVVAEPPRLKPTGSVAERADDLKNYLLGHVEVFGAKVHIIAHSMGGLDSRFMISKLGMAERVRSLTTIGTPHHGSPIADIVVAGTNLILNSFMEHLGVNPKGVFDLTTSACRKFNEEVPDAPEVHYFSIGGQFDPHRVLGVPQGLLALTHEIVQKTEGGNDGVVSLASATMQRPGWKTLDAWSANHWRLINWGENLAPSPLELADNSIPERYRNLVKLVKAASGS